MIEGDVVTDFCQTLDLERPTQNTTERRNTALSARKISLLRDLNEKIPYRKESRLNPLRADLV